jgi:hypothetical protein
VNPVVTIAVLLTADKPRATTLAVAFLLGFIAECVAAVATSIGGTSFPAYVGSRRRRTASVLRHVVPGCAGSPSMPRADRSLPQLLAAVAVAALRSARITSCGRGRGDRGRHRRPACSRGLSLPEKGRAVARRLPSSCIAHVALPLAIFSQPVCRRLSGGEFTSADVALQRQRPLSRGSCRYAAGRDLSPPAECPATAATDPDHQPLTRP